MVTEGRTPAEGYDLPPLPQDTDWRTYRNNARRWVTDSPHIAVLAEDREADAVLYGLPLYADASQETALIRWGDSLAEFDWPWLTPQQILPQLFCFDLDGDQEDELIAVCHSGSGTGISVDDLHVLEKSPGGTLTDYSLPWEFFREDLSEALSVETINGRTYSILGTELTDITDLLPLPEDADPENIDGLSAGDIINFEVVPEPRFYGENLRYRGAAWLRGEGFPSALCYAAEIEAVVSYRDGAFTLTQIHLS